MLTFRIAVLCHGAIGERVLHALRERLAPQAELAVFGRKSNAPDFGFPVAYFASEDQLLEWQPQLAVECAGHGVVATTVPRLLRSGADVVITSVGALADAGVAARLDEACGIGGARVLTVPGAIGGLDALAAACMQGPVSVRYVGRKPVAAWQGTPADGLEDLVSSRVIFEGSAREAARLFPKNANVTAAVALAGVGFERTQVQLIADPAGQTNVHELEVTGPFGEFRMRLENQSLPDNPKTSFLAALSVESTIVQYLRNVLPASLANPGR